MHGRSPTATEHDSCYDLPLSDPYGTDTVALNCVDCSDALILSSAFEVSEAHESNKHSLLLQRAVQDCATAALLETAGRESAQFISEPESL